MDTLMIIITALLMLSFIITFISFCILSFKYSEIINNIFIISILVTWMFCFIYLISTIFENL